MIPLAHAVEFWSPDTTSVDRFGDQRPGGGSWTPVRVAGWYVGATEETGGESVLRTSDVLTVLAPSSPGPAGRVRLPDGSVWQVHGNPQDYRHGPWWDPGLIAFECRKVQG